MARKIVTLEALGVEGEKGKIDTCYMFKDVMGFALHKDEAMYLINRLMRFYKLDECDEVALMMNINLAQELDDKFKDE